MYSGRSPGTDNNDLCPDEGKRKRPAAPEQRLKAAVRLVPDWRTNEDCFVAKAVPQFVVIGPEIT
jgi:hypothetical protein